MSNALMIALALLGVTFVFPFLALYLRPKRGTEKDDVVEIKASVLFWNIALPTLLLLLGALGFASYDEIVKTVSAAIKEDYMETINKAVIDSLVADIKKMREQAGAEKNAIAMLRAKSEVQSNSLDSILASTQADAGEIAANFLLALPKGTIIPYWGLRYNFDDAVWALCDGNNGTPDLRERFIRGSSFENIGSRGGTDEHKHVASLGIDGVVAKRNVAEGRQFSGISTGAEFKVERHEHVFRISKEEATIKAESNIPPFFRLVYLMKIK